MFKNKTRMADVALILTTVLWGATFSFTKNLSEFFGPFSYLAIRYLLGSGIIFAILFKQLKNAKFEVIIQSIFTAVLISIGMTFQIIGLYYISASESAFITAMSVVIVPAVMFLLYRKKPTKTIVIGSIMAYVGLFILTDVTKTGFIIGKGELYTFISAIFWTFYIILTNKYAKESNVIQLGAFQLFFSAILFIFLWLLFDREEMILNTYSIVGILIMGIFSTGVAYFFYTLAQKYTTESRSALILTLEPVFASVFACVIPDFNGVTEGITLPVILGGIIIFFATIIVEFNIFDKKRLTKKH